MPPISETRPENNTGNYVPYSFREAFPANQYREDAGDGAYSFSSLSEKQRPDPSCGIHLTK